MFESGSRIFACATDVRVSTPVPSGSKSGFRGNATNTNNCKRHRLRFDPFDCWNMNKTVNRWLDAHEDRSAQLWTLPHCLTFCDVSGTGEHRLVAAVVPRAAPGSASADTRSKLRVYRGTSLSCESTLPDVPSGVVGLYTEPHEPRVPVVAVACASSLLIFKNNKPFYRWSAPAMPVPALETDVWRRFGARPDADAVRSAVRTLETLTFAELSSRSQQLVRLPPEQAVEFAARYADEEPHKTAVITCVATLSRNSLNKDAAACLVVATEAAHVYVLDPHGFSILHQASVNSGRSAPVHVRCAGMFDVDYRIVVGCRDGTVSVLRREWFEGRPIAQLPSPIVDLQLLPSDHSFVVATADCKLHCYTKKGKKQWTVTTPRRISCVCLLELPHLSTCLVGAGLCDGPLQLYRGKNLVDVVPTGDTPSAVRFGQLGQEEHVLVIATRGGTLTFKILKRTADFGRPNASLDGGDADANRNGRESVAALPLPKRSRLFAEQAQRERENALSIHHAFQQDLIRLRLTAARQTVRDADASGLAVADKQPVKLAAQVLGLGPRFSLVLTLENVSADRTASDLAVVFHADAEAYAIESPYARIPALPPGLSYSVRTPVTERSDGRPRRDAEAGPTAAVRVFVVATGRTQPLLAAAINMPPTDPLGFA